MKKKSVFTRAASAAANAAGKPGAFLLTAAIVAAWAISGPIFKYSDIWQLVINTRTTIIRFLMVFLIQNAQNRDTKALQIKIDGLLRSLKNANNSMLDLEELDDDEIERWRKKVCQLAEEARQSLGDDNGGIGDAEGQHPQSFPGGSSESPVSTV